MAAEAAEAAGAEGKFWEMHDLLLRQAARLERKRCTTTPPNWAGSRTVHGRPG